MSQTTSFALRSDDEDALWPVNQIVAESAAKYKVEWVGVDPATGESWAPSWVPKSDCTGDLVAKWQKKVKSSKEDDMHKVSKVRGPVETTRERHPNLKRKQQSEQLTNDFDEPQIVTGRAKAQSSKKQKQSSPVISHPIKVGPPRGARKMHPTATSTNNPCLPSLSPARAPRLAHQGKPESLSVDRPELPPPSPALASRRVYLEELGFDSAHPPPLTPSLVPTPREVKKIGMQQEVREEQPNAKRGPFPSIATDGKSPNVITEADQLQLEYSRAPASCNMPDLSRLITNVEEIKRLQCIISINSNAALQLGMEVIEAIRALQKDSQ